MFKERAASLAVKVASCGCEVVAVKTAERSRPALGHVHRRWVAACVRTERKEK